MSRVIFFIVIVFFNCRLCLGDEAIFKTEDRYISEQKRLNVPQLMNVWAFNRRLLLPPRYKVLAAVSDKSGGSLRGSLIPTPKTDFKYLGVKLESVLLGFGAFGSKKHCELCDQTVRNQFFKEIKVISVEQSSENDITIFTYNYPNSAGKVSYGLIAFDEEEFVFVNDDSAYLIQSLESDLATQLEHNRDSL